MPSRLLKLLLGAWSALSQKIKVLRQMKVLFLSNNKNSTHLNYQVVKKKEQ